MLGQHDNIVRTVFQRRNIDIDHIQTIIQILTESAVFNTFVKITVRRGDNARIHLNRGFAADAVDFLS